MLLADSAQSVNGKLYILGGGWSVIGPDPSPMAVAMLIDVPWDQANRRHSWKLSLLDEDGQPVKLMTPIGDQELELTAEFEVGRPPGLKPGTPLPVPLAVNIGPLPLPPGRGYVWVCSINGETKEEWRLPFATRPAGEVGPARQLPG